MYFNRPNRKAYRRKRQKFKKKLKPCYICANWGHSGNFCPQVTTCPVCSKDESKNDVEEDHISLFCIKCGSTGHGILSCTNDYDPEDLKGIQCYVCMDFGHLCCADNSTEGPSEASCYNCGQSGHHGFECPKMKAAAKELRPVSICFKCQHGVHSPETGELDNKLTSTETTTLEKDEVPDESIKRKPRKAQIVEMDNKSISAETSTVRKDVAPDESTEGKSQKARRRESRRKRKPVMPTSNVVQSLPTKSKIENTIPRHGQYYGNPGSNVWLSSPTAAAGNCLVNSPALDQSSYARPGLNVWFSPPAAAARNYLEISSAINQSSYQTGFHFYHYNTYREATHVPPNSFRPCSIRPHEIFHQGTQIPGPPLNGFQLPYQSFIHQIRTNVPRSSFDSWMGISQQPVLPHHVFNHRIGASLPHQTLQHQLSSHRTWMAPPGWKPYS